MTSKISFFNKGIYKSLLKRYKWGSVLYFVLLFIIAVLSLLLDLEQSYIYTDVSLLYHRKECIIMPILLAMGVATAVGVLVFRFVHSKKASVFTHSLPVNRTAVYVSAIAGAFTLMAVPVVLIGLIFLIMALTAYSSVITVSSCFVWIGLNLLCLFMMFSCTSFVAMLTGNSYGLIGLNILFHVAVPVIALCFSGIAGGFLYGYVSDNAFLSGVAEGNFAMWIISTAARARHLAVPDIDVVRLVINLGISVLFYVLGWVLYKKRSLETAEDVAGFKCLNIVFKYLLTFLGATVSFWMFGSLIEVNLPVFVISVFLVSAVVYFASEMILKKSFKIWKKSFKGFVIFSAVFGLIVYLIAFTSFFGYETYVPEADEVESVAIYSYYYNRVPQLNDPEVIDYTVKLHNELVKNRDLLKSEFDAVVNINIGYKLKNGAKVSRVYLVNEGRLMEIISDLYEYDSYKAFFEAPLSLDAENIVEIVYDNNLETMYIYGRTAAELHECIVKDIKNLSYDELYPEDIWTGDTVKYTYKDDETGMHVVIYELRPYFVNTLKWIEDFDFVTYMPYFITKEELGNYSVKDTVYSYDGINYEGLHINMYTSDYSALFNFDFEQLEKGGILAIVNYDTRYVFDYLKTNNITAEAYKEYEYYIYQSTGDFNYRKVGGITADEVENFKKTLFE